MGVAEDGEPSDAKSSGEATATPVPKQGGPVDAQEPEPSEPSVPHQRERRDGANEAPESDSALLRRMRTGESAAYERLYRRHAEAVRRYARTCCRDAHTAEDLTNEVFARTLHAVRAGAGPETAVRAYLLTSVRRVAAAWARTAKREQLVEEFADFAQSAAAAASLVTLGTGEPGGLPVVEEDALSLPADVRAMREADRTMAVQAFRSLPEKYQTVLWHTTVEEESPKQVAPLLGLSDNATAVLAHRAREKLKQAFLQAHVARAGDAGGECARHAGRLGAYARGGLRMRAERGLRKHLEVCAQCRAAALEVMDLNAQIRLLVPLAFLGWFGASAGAKTLGLVAGGGAAGAAAGTGAAAASGAAGGGTAAEGLGAPVKVGIAAGVATAAGLAVALALVGADRPAPEPQSKPSVAPVAPSPRPPEPEPKPDPAEPRPAPPQAAPEPASPAPEPEPEEPAEPERLSPEPTPPSPTPSPTPTQAPPPETFRLNTLSWDVLRPGADRDRPTIRTGASSWLWQRYGLRIGPDDYAHGISVPTPSSVTIDLHRPCTAYDALAGVDGLTLGDRSVRFSVHGDGSRLWRSPVVGRDDAPVPVHVPLTGVRTLRLVVQPAGGEGPLGRLALADWAQSRISCR
jgi:RNA polymerase sigma factor (sigma-70 family)